jgi:uncharacterized membrane protein SpoIIM required for sporulation
VNPNDLTSFFDALKIVVGRRWPLIAFLFAVEIVVVLYVVNTPFFPKELSTYETEYKSIGPVLNTSAAGQTAAIYGNNFKVAAAELIPVVGLGVFGLSLYQTARIVEVIGIVKGIGAGFALANLFALPSTWLELPAYAIAAAESVYLVHAAYVGLKRSRRWFFREIKFLIVNLGLIAAVLAVAAVFEVGEIQIETITAGAPALDPSHAYVLLTWLPFVAIFAGVIVFWRRARREAPALEERDSMETAPTGGVSQGVGGPGLAHDGRGAQT